MSELRWILALVGAIVIAGVYLWSRRADAGSQASDVGRVEPSLEGVAGDTPPDADAPAGEMPEQARETVDPHGDDVTVPQRAPTPPPASGDQLTIPMPDDDDYDEESGVVEPERVIQLHVVARDDSPFIAADIVAALRAEGLRFAHHDVFHRFDTDGNPGPDEPPLFSVADMLKPGTFDLETLADKQLKGVSLFMGLPNPGDAVAVFADMLATGRRLAATFDGLLVDEQGCAISRQSASHMREDIINFQLEARRNDEWSE